MSSQQAHSLRVNTIEHARNLLKEKRKVKKEAVMIAIMRMSKFSKETARRYIDDLVMLGYAKNNGDYLEYVFDGKEKGKD